MVRRKPASKAGYPMQPHRDGPEHVSCRESQLHTCAEHLAMLCFLTELAWSKQGHHRHTS